jgi:hypothetical protein
MRESRPRFRRVHVRLERKALLLQGQRHSTSTSTSGNGLVRTALTLAARRRASSLTERSDGPTIAP